MTDTFYDVLGVPPDATTEEIEAAYRERLKESHPDLSDDADAEERTRRVIRARDVLTDEGERERYDRLGHEAYTKNSTSSVDDSDVSSAAAAARRAGWGGDTDTGSTEGRDQGSSGTGSRRRTHDRRQRERAARERISREADATGGTAGGDAARSARASGTATGGVGNAVTEANHRSTNRGSRADSSPTWQNDGGYSVRQDVDVSVNAAGLFDQNQSLTVLVIAFALYPVMLFSAIFPPFPLVFNLSVAVCVVFFVGYLQSMPEVGVVVFGGWSILTPLLFDSIGLELASLVGIMGVLGTVVPFGLSTLTYWVMRA